MALKRKLKPVLRHFNWPNLIIPLSYIFIDTRPLVLGSFSLFSRPSVQLHSCDSQIVHSDDDDNDSDHDDYHDDDDDDDDEDVDDDNDDDNARWDEYDWNVA